MNPLIIETLFSLGAKALDTVLTKKKKDVIQNTKPKFDPNQTTMAKHAKAVAAHEAEGRQLAPVKSVIVTGVSIAAYVAMSAGYFSPASVQCMIDAAQEAEAKVIEQQAK